MSKKLAIRGHATRGKEVIELLEMMGGTNPFTNGMVMGNKETNCYYIIEDIATKLISWDYIDSEEIDKYKIFTLEEFLEKYPFKVGDKVTLDNKLCSIIWMCWECNNIYYQVQETDVMFTKKVAADELKPYKETNMNEDKYRETFENKILGYKVDDVIFTNDTGWIRITNKLWDCYAEEHVYEGIGILNGHEYKDIRHHNVTGKMELGRPEFCKAVDDVRYVNSITDDIMINQITNKVSVIKLKPDVCDDEIELQLGNYDIEVRDGRTFAVKKKPKYPKNYKKCCQIVGGIASERHLQYDTIPSYKFEEDLRDSLETLRKLIICRNVYWKIAGEQMGLGKPWEPDYKNPDIDLYVIINIYNRVEKAKYGYGFQHCIFTFPTEEMRDAFYENFKDLIEQCRELL